MTCSVKANTDIYRLFNEWLQTLDGDPVSWDDITVSDRELARHLVGDFIAWLYGLENTEQHSEVVSNS